MTAAWVPLSDFALDQGATKPSRRKSLKTFITGLSPSSSTINVHVERAVETLKGLLLEGSRTSTCPVCAHLEMIIIRGIYLR